MINYLKISLFLLISIVTNLVSHGQSYEGVGVGTSYKINLPTNSGYYFQRVVDTGMLFNHYVYLKQNESVEFNYKKIANGTTNVVPGKYYIYSPIGLEDSIILTTSLTNVISKTFLNIPASKQGIWTVKMYRNSITENDNVHNYFIKVTNSANVVQLGRSYLSSFPVKMGISTNEINFSIYTVTPYGYNYKTDFFKFAPINGSIFSSPHGLYLPTAFCRTINKSGDLIPGANAVQKYVIPYECGNMRKLFYNPVDPTLPESAPIYDFVNHITRQEWLNPFIKKPTPVSLNFIPSPTNYNEGYFEYQIDSFDGNVLIKIDVNNNGVFTDNVDLNYYEKVNNGINHLYFNGKDNLGNVIPCGTPINVVFSLDKLGENHIILSDIEGLGGIRQQRLTGINLPDFNLTWNDSIIFNLGNRTGRKDDVFATLKNSNVDTGIHGWHYNASNSWGNNSFIDNYSYIPVDTLILRDTLVHLIDKGNLANTWPVANVTYGNKRGAYVDGVWLGTNKPQSSCVSNVAQNDGVHLFQTSPVSGIGSETNPFVLRPDQATQISIHKLTNQLGSDYKWAIWVDVNKNGLFTDADDMFITSNYTTLSSLSSYDTTSLSIPYLMGDGDQEMVMRVVITKNNVAFTKAMNGNFNIVNGEIEDYYMRMVSPISLPLTLINFSVNKLNEQSVSVNFSTSHEVNIKSFEIMYSSDAVNWNKLGTVKPLDQNSDETKYYEYIANHEMTKNRYYYKLGTYDDDGAVYWSGIKTLDFNHNRFFEIYPNPANAEITIRNPKSVSGVARIMTLQGHLVEQQSLNPNANNIILIEKLSPGVYCIAIQTEDGGYEVFKFIKN